MDPTVSFSGLDLWKRNLALLTPFLIQPSLQLLALHQAGTGGSAPASGSTAGGAAGTPAAGSSTGAAAGAARGSSGSDQVPQLEATWKLATWLNLPWRPLIAIEGSTLYTLNTDSTRITKHVESW